MDSAVFEGVGLVPIERFQASLTDSDLATVQTVRAMCGVVQTAAKDPAVWRAAKEALRQFSCLAGAFRDDTAPAETSETTMCDAAWWWAKHRLHFLQDDTQILQRLNERDQLELLVTPSVLVRMNRPQGDCDDYTMLLAAFLSVYGVRWRVVVVASDPESPTLFTHVFLAAVLPDGSLYYLDASHGAYPGWRVPDEHVFRSQMFDESGAVVRGGNLGSAPAPAFRGLHGYMPTRAGYLGMGAVPRARPAMPYYHHGRRALRGLGCGALAAGDPCPAASGLGDDDGDTGVSFSSVVDSDLSSAGSFLDNLLGGSSDSTVLSSGGNVLSSSIDSDIANFGSDISSWTSEFEQAMAIPLSPSSSGVTASGAAAGSTSSSAITSDINSMLQAWTKIAGNVIAPTTTIYNPATGLMVSTPAGSATGAALLGGTSLTSLLGSSSSMTWILLLGAVGVGFLMMSKR
jgi:hypothetical protein